MDVDSSWCSRKPARRPQGTGDTPVFMGSTSPSRWHLAWLNIHAVRIDGTDALLPPRPLASCGTLVLCLSSRFRKVRARPGIPQDEPWGRGLLQTSCLCFHIWSV